MCTLEWCQWKSSLHSPKLQHYLSFTIRSFNVILGHSLGGGLTVGVFYTPTDWASEQWSSSYNWNLHSERGHWIMNTNYGYHWDLQTLSAHDDIKFKTDILVKQGGSQPIHNWMNWKGRTGVPIIHDERNRMCAPYAIDMRCIRHVPTIEQREKGDFDTLKCALLTAFTMDSFAVYGQFMECLLRLRETVDIFLVDLKRFSYYLVIYWNNVSKLLLSMGYLNIFGSFSANLKWKRWTFPNF